MRRAPNPWVAVPVLIAALAGGIVGYFVMDASCAPDSCTVSAALVATVVGLAGAAGIGIIAVLALKSLDEFRTHRDREILAEVDPPDSDPGPPTC